MVVIYLATQCHVIFAAPTLYMSDANSNAGMKRVGRPPTGLQPRLSMRMEASMLKLASQHAKAKGHTVGRGLEEAIREKIEGEKGEEDVIKADLLIRNIKNHHPVVPYVVVHTW